MSKNKSSDIVPVGEANLRTSVTSGWDDEDSDAAQEVGAYVEGDLAARCELVVTRVSHLAREAVRIGYVLLTIKRDVPHGQFSAVLEQMGIGVTRAAEFMRMAKLITRVPEGQRLAALEIHKSKLNVLASADPQVVEVLIEDGIERIDVVSVRALRARVTELEAQVTDTTVQRDQAEAEAEGLRKKLSKAPTDRSDQVPLVVADLRAEIAANVKKAELAIEAFNGIGSDLGMLLGTEVAYEWTDGIARQAFAALGALALQINGQWGKWAKLLPDQEREAGLAAMPATAHYSPQELVAIDAEWRHLTDLHAFEKAQREWERQQERPAGRGRPKAKPEAPVKKANANG